MVKKILLFVFFSQSFIQADLPSQDFGFNQTAISRAEKDAQWTVKTALAKKYGSRALFATALGLYAYRVFSKNIPENCVLVQVAPPVDQGWVTWTIQNAVSLGGKIVEGIATQSLVSFYFSVLPGYNITCDTQWFFTKKTQIKVLTENLTEAFAQLLILEDQEKIEYQVTAITYKIELLTKELIRLIGFLRYSQQQQEQFATFNAVCMDHVIKNIEKTTKTTLEELYCQLCQYKELQIDMPTKAQKAADLNATFVHYAQSLFADVKTFSIYQNN
ncbi:MAG: hypothetical protein EBU90_22335 [Proteobacteria bacterium]|nr:hypothetical protein [Pseudomonadota bacterium]NBP15353.1 hypothetical protein [bacterium]